MSAMASQITSLTIVYSTIYSGVNQRKLQSSASLAFVRRPVNFPHKRPVTRKMFPFDHVIMAEDGHGACHTSSNRYGITLSKKKCFAIKGCSSLELLSILKLKSIITTAQIWFLRRRMATPYFSTACYLIRMTSYEIATIAISYGWHTNSFVWQKYFCYLIM